MDVTGKLTHDDDDNHDDDDITAISHHLFTYFIVLWNAEGYYPKGVIYQSSPSVCWLTPLLIEPWSYKKRRDDNKWILLLLLTMIWNYDLFICFH